jgi:DNA-binding NtrC family response regulator
MQHQVLLLVAANQPLRQLLVDLTRTVGVALVESPGKSALSRFFENAHPALVVIGPAVEHQWDALHIARLVRQWNDRVPIVVVTAHGSEELAVAFMRTGVSDYFKTPFDANDLGEAIRDLLAPSRSCDDAVRKTTQPVAYAPTPLIGAWANANRLSTSIDTIAASDSNVLITGETGTGKELTATLIHGRSRRSKYPFVSINCAAIPESLVESELFGYERGAFTGAASLNIGRLSAAHRGTAFLDEIGDLSPTAQAKVLRLVDAKEVHRLGSTRSLRVDARIVTATNQNLEALISEGRFRNDLYFRLNVARIHLAPLRERRDDIPLLLDYYVRIIRTRLGRDVDGFADTALDALTAYDWPGNIRELKNVVERTVMTAAARLVAVDDLPAEIRSGVKADAAPRDSGERARVLAALASANGNKSEAARALCCSRMTLYRKIAKCNLRSVQVNTAPRRRTSH